MGTVSIFFLLEMDVTNQTKTTSQAPTDLAMTQSGQGTCGATGGLNAGFSGVHVRINPVKTESGIKFEAEIRSGYRAGNVLCHAQTDNPVRWSSATAAQNWLTETGYTVIFDPKTGALAKPYALDHKGQIWGSLPQGNFIEQPSTNVERRIWGLFTKQVWGGRKGDDAIFIGNEQFDATESVLKLSHAALVELQDNDESTDEIGRSIVEWDGPCEVQCVAATCEFFGVESLEDVTPKMLEEARQLFDVQLPGNVQEGEDDADEIIVKLADGCTLRSGVDDPDAEGALTAGDYVRLCGPDGKEIQFWSKDEWQADPALVMGAIMIAASGNRLQPSVDIEDSHTPGK